MDAKYTSGTVMISIKTMIAACIEIHFETRCETINPDDKINNIFDILNTRCEVPKTKTIGTNEARGLCVCGLVGAMKCPEL